MKSQFHREITEQALREHVSARALEMIIIANLGQDRLQYQVGYPHFHFDDNSFPESWEYIELQRDAVLQGLQDHEVEAAWSAFGRLTHTVQDFYAHSNYISLWLQKHDSQNSPAAEAIDPFDGALLTSPDLSSGRIYFPLEAFAFVPFLKKLVIPILPRDSHAWMNQDDPTRPLFAFAFSAAEKATLQQFNRTAALMDPQSLAVFSGY